MKFGGFQKNSMIDYPNRISSVVFTSGCNFSCPYCHNPILVKGGDCQIDEHEILAFMEKRKGLLDGVVITGGEPTLQPGLAGFCRQVKQKGFDVKLDTNGSHPDVLTRLIRENLVDYIAMDIKSDSAGYEVLWGEKHDFKQILDSIDIIMTTAPEYEFRTTCLRPYVDEDIMVKMAGMIQDAPLFALQKFRNSGVLEPSFFENGENEFSDREMLALRSIAAPFVKKCIIR